MKKFVLSVFASTILLSSSAVPAHAQENIFQQVMSSVSDHLQRIYLMLPGDKSGQAVMEQSWKASQNVKSATANSTITMDFLSDSNSIANLKLNVSGPFESQGLYDPQIPKQDLSLTSELSMQGTTLRAAANVKIIDKTIYFQINEAPVLPFFDFTPLKGKWLKTNAPSKTTTQNLSDDQKQKLKDIYTKLLSSFQASSAHKETKNDHSVFVVEATIPKQAVSDYLKQVSEVVNSTNTTLTPDQTPVPSNFDTMLDNVGDLKATLWIDSSSYYVRHVELPITYKIDKQNMPEAGSATGPMAALSKVNSVNMMIVADLDKFNEPVSVDEPKDAEDAQQAIQGVMQGGQPGLTGAMSGAVPPSDFNVGSTELPTLTPKQRLLLQKYKTMPPVPVPSPAAGGNVPVLPAY